MVVKTAATSSNKPQPNPWEALISSATRARPTRPVLTTAFSGESADGSGNTSLSSSAGGGGGYTILLQHSLTPKSQRKWALESTMAVMDKSSNSSNNINSGTRSNKSNNTAPSSSSSSRSRSGGGGDWYGISGPFLVRQALYDLSTRCNGRVVFVSVTGTTGILDLDALQDNNDASSSSSLRLFRQNGACVDLSSNPFGWNDDENYEDNNNHCNNNSFVTKATMSNLQSLASAIRQAASNIIISRSKDEAIDNISKDQKSKSEGNLQLQQPIPIIFETMTSLLQLHGVERITVLLKSLGRMTLLDNNNDNNSNSTSSVLSPIIVPVLYESICLSDHRTLEDCADAMVSLKLMDTVTSATTSIDAVEAKDDKDIVVVTGVMDLVRRGGGGNGGLGGKLMRHCVPIHILRSKTTTTMGDLRNSCYWIVGSDDNDNTRQEGEEDDDVTEKGKTEMRSSHNTALDQSPTSSAAPKSSRPQIYLQDDDPDFQDYDEDDDLDL
ncbi:hypothetical protein ACHAWC_001034 [Mediolabrus comicus]